jgi:hypothetical protein
MTVFQGPTNINLLFKSNGLTSTANLLEVIPDRPTVTIILNPLSYLHVRLLLVLHELLFWNFTLGGICLEASSGMRSSLAFPVSPYSPSEE